jgi:hypothetical protein
MTSGHSSQTPGVLAVPVGVLDDIDSALAAAETDIGTVLDSIAEARSELEAIRYRAAEVIA